MELKRKQEEEERKRVEEEARQIQVGYMIDFIDLALQS